MHGTYGTFYLCPQIYLVQEKLFSLFLNQLIIFFLNDIYSKTEGVVLISNGLVTVSWVLKLSYIYKSLVEIKYLGWTLSSSVTCRWYILQVLKLDYQPQIFCGTALVCIFLTYYFIWPVASEHVTHRISPNPQATKKLKNTNLEYTKFLQSLPQKWDVLDKQFINN